MSDEFELSFGFCVLSSELPPHPCPPPRGGRVREGVSPTLKQLSVALMLSLLAALMLAALEKRYRDSIQKNIKGESIVNKTPNVEKRGIICIRIAEESPTFSS